MLVNEEQRRSCNDYASHCSLVLACLALIASILLQSGKRAGLSGSIGGGAEQIWGKQKAHGMEAVFDRITKIAAIVFIAGALLLVIMQ